METVKIESNNVTPLWLKPSRAVAKFEADWRNYWCVFLSVFLLILVYPRENVTVHFKPAKDLRIQLQLTTQVSSVVFKFHYSPKCLTYYWLIDDDSMELVDCSEHLTPLRQFAGQNCRSGIQICYMDLILNWTKNCFPLHQQQFLWFFLSQMRLLFFVYDAFPQLFPVPEWKSRRHEHSHVVPLNWLRGFEYEMLR